MKGSVAKYNARRNRRRAVEKLQQLDHRSRLYAAFNAFAKDVQSDLGGHLGALESTLVQTAAGLKIKLNEINCRIVANKPVSIEELSTLVSSFCRVASRLGLERRARDITNLADYLKARHKHNGKHDGDALDGEILSPGDAQ